MPYAFASRPLEEVFTSSKWQNKKIPFYPRSWSSWNMKMRIQVHLRSPMCRNVQLQHSKEEGEGTTKTAKTPATAGFVWKSYKSGSGSPMDLHETGGDQSEKSEVQVSADFHATISEVIQTGSDTYICKGAYYWHLLPQ